MIEHGIDKPFMITFLFRVRGQCETIEDYITAPSHPIWELPNLDKTVIF